MHSLVPFCRSPPTQPSFLIHPKPENLRFVPLRLHRCRRRTNSRNRPFLSLHHPIHLGYARRPRADRLTFRRDQLRVYHQEQMGESRPEISTVYASVTVRFGRVNVFTFRTVKFYCFLVGNVRKADREERLGMAVDTRAASEICFSVLVHLKSGSARRGLNSTVGYVGKGKAKDHERGYEPFCSILST